MSGERSSHRDLWLPGLVGLVGALVSLAGWGLLVGERRSQILQATTGAAMEVREAIELGMAEQAEALEGLAKYWSQFGLQPDDEWRAAVEHQVDQLDGVRFVAWAGLDGSPDRITASRGRSAQGIEIDEREVRRHRREPGMVGPLRDAAGEPAYRYYLPVRTHDGHVGTLVAQIDVKPFLEAMLRARGHGYALSLSWDGQQIFARGKPSSDPWQRWWRVEGTVRLPFEQYWRIVHRPTAEYAAARLTPVPHYLLAAGLLLSLALAVLTHQLRLTVRQSRFLSASNRALEQRGDELETRVAERTEALEDAIGELEAFNYSVSHDLRSPLGAILNFAAILEEDYRGRPLDAEGVRILARIRRSAMRATALLEDLLQLSRAGRAALSLEPVDMAALARESFAQVRAAGDEADEAVEFLVEPLPDAVGDRALLGALLANLFSNALKYSRGREKRRIRVTGRVEDGECIYEVEDNGHGFDMRFANKLFGLFERLHSAEEIEGTGVGLAMVARIVKRHGGRVWAHGQPGQGARFGFAIPVPHDHAAAETTRGEPMDGETP
jgi:two-component system sensor kinase